METGKPLLPIFCNIEPSELRVAEYRVERCSAEQVKLFADALEEAKRIVGLRFKSDTGNWSQLGRTLSRLLKGYSSNYEKNALGQKILDPDVVSLGIPKQLETEAEVGEDGHLHMVIRRSLPRSISGSFSDMSLQLNSEITGKNQHASELTGAEMFSLRSSSRRSRGYPRDIYDTKKFRSTGSLGGMLECNDAVNLLDDRTHCGSPRDTVRPNWGLHMHIRSSSDKLGTTNQTVHPIDISPVFEVQDEPTHSTGTSSRRDEGSVVKVIQGGHSNNNNNNKKPPGHVMAKLIIGMAWKKFIQNPNTGACFLGLAWSLIRVRFKLEMPTMLQGCVTIITNTSLGLAMYSLGLFTGLQPKIISCDRTAIILSLVAKFLFAPLLMALLSLALGLRGTTLNIAILQLISTVA